MVRTQIRWSCLLALPLTMVVAIPAAAQPSIRVTVGLAGAQPNGLNGTGVISGNGQFVAFVSDASNLVAADTNASSDVFVRDLTGGTTSRVSVATDGLERSGPSGTTSAAGLAVGSTAGEFDISDDGRFVVFTSRAPLAAGDTQVCETLVANCPDVYLRDRQTNETTRISVGTAGTQSNGSSRAPQISGDGRWIVFLSDATNLVAGDTNGTTDVFLFDRQTIATTRISRATDGTQADLPSSSPSISRDGGVVAFVSASALLSAEPDTVACERAPPACRRPFMVDRIAGTTRRIPMPAIETQRSIGEFPLTFRVEVGGVRIAPDGQSIGVNGTSDVGFRTNGSGITGVNWIYDRALARITFGTTDTAIADWDGRHLASASVSNGDIVFGTLSLSDVIAGSSEEIATISMDDLASFGNLGDDGRRLVLRTSAGRVASDTDANYDVYVIDRDPDADGMPSTWETRFGLDPAVADGAADADGDGIANAAEWARASHPRGTEVRYHAEGASNAFFSTTFAVLNPNAVPATVVLRYQGDNSRSWSSTTTIPARQRRDFNAEGQFAASYATTIESDQPVIADRTMTWGGGYGSHAETAIVSPSTTWFLAEGATHGAFSLFYLLQNPGPTTANVGVTYLRPAPAPPLTIAYQVPAASRLTIAVDAVSQLAATDVSARIVSDTPILVERAMYMDTVSPAQVFGAGHAGAGVTATNPRWFLAEGATGSFFDLYYLIANPTAQATRIRVTYLLPAGAPLTKEYDVPAESRVTISVDGEDARLIDTPVSAIVESLDAVGIVVERSMWWPGQGQWYEGHLAAGATATSLRWGLAAGLVAPGTETYVLIANTSASAGNATVTALPSAGGTPSTLTVALPANSRVTVPMSQVVGPPSQPGASFGTLVESDGPQIVVERAIYSDHEGVVWSAGSAALATPLP
ncbi:MAG: hypothetical protein ABIT71_14965 [Vicinamibacteraceae bacterium]